MIAWIKRNILEPPTFDNEEDAKQGRIIYGIVLISLPLVIAIALSLVTISQLSEGFITPFARNLFWILVIFFFVLGGVAVLLRKRYVENAKILLIITLFLGSLGAAVNYGGLNHPLTYDSFVFLVALSGLLLGIRAVISVWVANSLAFLFLLYIEQAGILVFNPDSINIYFTLSAHIGVMGMIAAILSYILRTITANLEKIEASEKDLAKQNLELETNRKSLEALTLGFRTSLQVSQSLSTILEPDHLIIEVVNQVKEAFNYYYAHIYLFDLQHEKLNMAGGTGEAGRIMFERKHSLNVGQGLVGRAARDNEIVLVSDVTQNPTWMPNPLLPETKSEVAVPISFGGQVLGVLDVQHSVVNGIQADDAEVLQSVANQVAGALQNARLFSETQVALQQAERVQRIFTTQSWEEFRASRATTDYEYHSPSIPPLIHLKTPEAIRALQEGKLIKTEELSGQGNGNTIENDEVGLAIPLTLRKQAIGVLGIRDDNPNRRWSDDEIALIESITEQMTQAIENARLFEAAERQAAREREIANITSEVWASAELEEVMHTAVKQLGKTLAASEVVIRLGTSSQLVSTKM